MSDMLRVFLEEDLSEFFTTKTVTTGFMIWSKKIG